MKFTLEQLKEHRLVPKDVNLINENECISLTEYSRLTSNEKVINDKAVIADDSVWVATGGKKTFTFDNKGFLWITSKKTITKFKINENGDEILKTPVQVISLSQPVFKEEQSMEMNGLNNLAEATAQINALKGAQAKTTVTASNSFSGKDDKAANKEKRDALTNLISAEVSKSGIRDTQELWAFNQAFGRLIGYVVPTGEKVAASLSTVTVKDDKGNPKLDPNAPVAVKQEFEKTGKADKEYYLKNTEIRIRQSAPGAPKGIVFSIPMGGFVPRSELRKNEPGPVSFDRNNKDLAIYSMEKDQAISVIISYFGEKIKESEITHGDLASELTVKTTAGYKDGVPELKFRLKPANRNRPVISTNYIPQKEIYSIPYSELKGADKELADKSLFWSVVTSKNFSKLSSIDQGKFTTEGENENMKITSSYIGKGEGINVTDFLTKEGIANPSIPIKTFVLGKGETKAVRARYAVYDVLNPDKSTADCNPETMSKYAPFRKALGGITIAQAVKDASKKKQATSTGSKDRINLSAVESAALIEGLMSGPSSVTTNLKIDVNTGTAITQKISEIAYRDR